MITIQILPQLLNQQEFECWLLTKKKSDYVGMRATAYCCPIANWLKESYNVSVDIHGSEIIWSQNKIESPAWIKDFVKQVDLKKQHSTFCTTQEALVILGLIMNNEAISRQV
ncbi:hypothetical protein [Microcoleus sp. B4-C1]|uniref:hypothetical protein n=1 Tax=Microcoleus sp. B4-C1 TaxID=2818660 RepID=UPI002FD48264